jgi:enoyl-CoA hydratase/carnithine racemase
MNADEAKSYGLVDEVVKSRKELKLPDTVAEAAALPEGTPPQPQTSQS